MRRRFRIASIAAACTWPALLAAAQPPAEHAAAADLASKLSNPVAALISVPFQSNLQFGVGPDDGMRYLLNFQPVVPFALGERWNLIARCIVPVIGQTAFAPGTESVGGLGDVLLSSFLSPGEPGPVIWGVGPALLFPSATDDLLGNGKWGAGPTVVALHQSKPWTVGVLANQVWSYAGEDDRPDVDRFFLQPFVAYNTDGGMTLTLSSETSVDWEADSGEHTSLPVIFQLSQIAKLDQALPVSFGAGAGYYVVQTSASPSWQLRFVLTLILPKG